MQDNIRITGTLATNVAISAEQLACIPTILEDNDLGDCTTVSAGYPETVRIDFDFTGARTHDRSTYNRNFLEAVVRVADICEEINLGLVGEVFIEDVPGFRECLEVLMLEVSDGKGFEALGRVDGHDKYQWTFSGVEVPLTSKPLNFG